MDFTTLPHKLLQPEEFDRQVVQLRTRFTEKQNSFFKPVYHKRIPADGFAPYLSNIWVCAECSSRSWLISSFAATSLGKQRPRLAYATRIACSIPMRRDCQCSICDFRSCRLYIPKTCRCRSDPGRSWAWNVFIPPDGSCSFRYCRIEISFWCLPEEERRVDGEDQ